MFPGHTFRPHPLARTLLGTIASATAAALVCAAARHHTAGWLPIAFVIVVLVIAQVFGATAGILGSIIAAVIFAVWLYPPLGRVGVQDSAARAGLAWMILAGTSLSFLLAPAGGSTHKHH